MTYVLGHPKVFIWASINYLVTYTNFTPQPSSGKVKKRENEREREREISTYNTLHATPFCSYSYLAREFHPARGNPARERLYFSALFHFSLILYFLNGCLDGLLVTQELVRPNSMQVLVQLQENGDASRESDVDDVVI